MQKSKHFIFILFILINFYFYYVSILIGEKLCWSDGVREKVSHSFVPWTSTILNLMVQNPRLLVQKFCQVHKPNGGRKNKKSVCSMAKLKEIFNLILSSMRFAFMTMR